MEENTQLFQKFIEQRLSDLFKDHKTLRIAKIERHDDPAASRLRNDQFWERIHDLTPYLATSYYMSDQIKVVIFTEKLTDKIKPFTEKIEQYMSERAVFSIGISTMQRGEEKYLAARLAAPEWVVSNEAEVFGSIKFKQDLFITIIDDDEIIQVFLQDQLEDAEWGGIKKNIQWFREPEAFITSGRLELEGKHLVILDGVLPRMDGFEVLKWVRDHYSRKQVEVVMISGKSKEQEIVQAFELGAFDYVTKPFKIYEVMARLKRTAEQLIRE